MINDIIEFFLITDFTHFSNKFVRRKNGVQFRKTLILFIYDNILIITLI